jgi:hypothetical protein
MDKVEKCLKTKCGTSRSEYTMLVIDLAIKYSKNIKKIKTLKDKGKITNIQFYERYDKLLKEAQEDPRYVAYNKCTHSKCEKVFKDQIKVIIDLCKQKEEYKQYSDLFTKAYSGKIENVDLVQTLRDMRRFFMNV